MRTNEFMTHDLLQSRYYGCKKTVWILFFFTGMLIKQKSSWPTSTRRHESEFFRRHVWNKRKRVQVQWVYQPFNAFPFSLTRFLYLVSNPKVKGITNGSHYSSLLRRKNVNVNPSTLKEKKKNEMCKVCGKETVNELSVSFWPWND